MTGCWWQKKVARWLATGAVLLAGIGAAPGQVYADYHQHFLSPAVAGRAAKPEKPFTAREMVALLDQARIRHALVLSRMLFGSDGAFGGGMTPEAALAAFHKLPFTREEFRAMEGNRTAYLR